MNRELIQQATVRILRDEITSGTGFLVTSSGHILTCWHVIEPLLAVQVVFENQQTPINARLCKNLSNLEEDIAVLKIDPVDRTPVPLGLDWNIGDEIWTYGYQYREHFLSGYPLKGIISGETAVYQDQQLLVISDTDVQRGMSGAPLFDQRTNKVVGIVNAKFDDKGIGFAIPISNVLRSWPQLGQSIVKEQQEFISEVASLFSIQGYKVETRKALGTNLVVDVYGEIAFGVTKIRMIAACFQSIDSIQVSNIEEFAYRVCLPLFNQRLIEKAFFVTDKGYTTDAVKLANEIGIQLINYNDLQGGLIDFSGYLGAIVYDYENHSQFSKGQRYPIIEYFRWCDLKKYYIDLRCMLLSNGEEYDSLDRLVDQWIAEDTPNYLSVVESPTHLSVLGNYGTGKTSFCLHLTYRLAKRYLENPIGNRIPVYFSLRNFDPEASIRRCIMETLADYGIIVNDYIAFEKMANSGKLLLIFDGFDEMVDKLDKKNVVMEFNKISKLVTMHSKVILTCRTHYFRTESESVDILAPENMTELMLEIKNRASYRIAEIKEFNQEQILVFLGRYSSDPLQYWENIQSVYNLADLARRPILLNMIVQTLPELLTTRKQVNSTSLYDVYTKYWIERDDWRSSISKEGKMFFAEELAWQMFISDKSTIPHEALSSTIKIYFQDRVDTQDNLRNLVTNVQTCSFLIRDKYGSYAFVHKSFMEFFVAKKLAKDIRSKKKENLSLKAIPVEIVAFLKDLLSPDDISTVKGFVIYQEEYNEWLRSVCADILMFLGETIKEIPMLFAVSYSIDSQYIATGSADGNIRIWDASSAKLLHVIKGHSDWVRTVAHSPNGKFLASSGWDGIIKIWNTHDYTEYLSLDSSSKVVSVVFSPDSQILTSGGFDRTVKLWDVKNGTLLGVLSGHHDSVWRVCYSPDGRYIASSSLDKTVRLWDAESRKLISIFRGHTEAVASVCIDPTGQFIVSGGWAGEMYIWSIQKQELVCRIRAHTNKINMFSFSPDGKYMASAGDDRKVKIWTPESWELVHVLSEIKDFVMTASYSPDGKTLSAGGYDTKLTGWNAKTWELSFQVSQQETGRTI